MIRSNQKKEMPQQQYHPQPTAINHADRKSWWCGSFRGSYNKDLVDRIIEIKKSNS
jgi:hypothetical protein